MVQEYRNFVVWKLYSNAPHTLEECFYAPQTPASTHSSFVGSQFASVILICDEFNFAVEYAYAIVLDLNYGLS